MNTVPTWAKTIGIMMICLAALGFIGAINKISFPTQIEMQGEIMDGFGEETGGVFGNRMMNTMKSMLVISPFQAYTVMVSGIVTLLGCGFYLFAGIRMLKLDVKNLKLTRIVLIGFIVVNALTVVFVLTGGSYSMMVMTAILYPLIGLIFDVVLLIVMASSDKSVYYGVGVEKSENIGQDDLDDLDDDII